jgi:uncharacterized membrane protein YbhN (UPF0104 family)
MLLALWPATPLAALPVCIGIYAIAWDFGFVTFITPSGLGFRELAIGVLFALALPFVPGALVAVIALLSRVVSTFAELLCVSVAYLSGGKQVRAVQQEQMNTPASSSAEQDVAEKNADLPSEAPAPDMV